VESLSYIGHAAVGLRLGGVSLLTDPMLRRGLGPLRRIGPAPDPAVSKDVDAVLISHLHRDHLDLPSLRRFGDSTVVVVPRGAATLAGRARNHEIRELEPGESTSIGSLTIRAVPALHGGHRDGKWGLRVQPLGYVVEGGGSSVYFAGDTDIYDEMAEIGPVDVALLPIWGWGRTLGEGHLDPRRAAEALALIRPSAAVPIHWGTFYPLGLSLLDSAPLREPPLEFKRHAEELAPEVSVRILQPGSEMQLPG